jgi:uncharacterized protein YecE (DUF72 family)
MSIWVGTSGYNYPEWKGTFYPQDLPAARMLPFYAQQFATVEINNSFYRMPTEAAVSGWAQSTPERFRLTLKAPQAITHYARLRNCADRVTRFIQVADTLGSKQGALLFQLPPNLKQDLPLLDDFLAYLPEGTRAAFEFRHMSWLAPAVYERLKARNLALCVADSEKLSTPVEITANHAYFRLRDEGYTPRDIERWAAVIAEKTAHCVDVFVYFKHEESGTGPQFAKSLLKALG